MRRSSGEAKAKVNARVKAGPWKSSFCPGSKPIAALAADAIETLLRRKPDAVLGLATGSSPLPVYDELVLRHERDGLDFSLVRAFALDEYVGLPAGHPESYREVIRREFTERVNIEPANVHGPDGSAADIPAACQAYEDAIRGAGGVDLQTPGRGHGRPHRIQRARLIPGLADADQDPDRADTPGQRTVFREPVRTFRTTS